MTTAPPPRPPRPREVTFGGVQAVVGGALALVLLIEAAQQLYSTEMEDVLRQALASPRAAGLDMTLDTARTMAKVAIMVMAVMAVMSAVLGIYVLRRHRASRIALTALGLLVAVTTLFAGPSGWAVTLYVGGSLALLWTKASRAWFSDPPAPPPAWGPPSPGWPPPPPPGPPPPAGPPPPGPPQR